jgi:5'-3' exonuclease
MFMTCNLLLDGNYILSKLVFTLNKNNLLYGALHKSLENTINSYKKWYPFANIYLVSDSKEKSWRKRITGDYKSTRKKDSDIDWEFVYQAYSEFKEGLVGIKVMESPHVEGDDWIAYICAMSNKNNISNIIVSNDYDIKQLLKYNIDPLWINIMTNEMYNKQKLFLPINYQVFLDKLNKLPNDDIFNLNNNSEFIGLMNRYLNRYEINEINPTESLVIKLISGDKSDNISSAWSQVKNGKKRGIGDKGAQFIYEQYVSEFGDIDLDDIDLYENIADLICEKKKLSKTQIESIIDNIKFNSKLIDLRIKNIPDEIVKKMEDVYGNG